MKKTCLIRQPAGIGDILFCQKIAKTIQEETDYKKIIWPVSPEYHYLRDYLIVDDVEFPLETENFPYKDVYNSGNLYMVQTDDFLYVPLHTCDQIERYCKCHNNVRAHGHMKYNFCNIEYTNWKDYFNIKRNYKKENELFDKLKLDVDEPYNFINNHYGTFPNYTTVEITPNNNFRNVYMDFIEGFSLFDWCKVFEHAKEIHTMECGVWYILDKLELKNVFIYSKYGNHNNLEKHPPDDFSYMKDNCNQNWKLIN